MTSRFGVIPESEIGDLEEALLGAEDLAESSRNSWGLRHKDKLILALALAAERAVAAEAELAELRKEVAGLRLTVSRMKKSKTTNEENA